MQSRDRGSFARVHCAGMMMFRFVTQVGEGTVGEYLR